MDILYLAATKKKDCTENNSNSFSDHELIKSFKLEAPLETFIIAFVLCYSEHKNVDVQFVESKMPETTTLYTLPNNLCKKLNHENQEQLIEYELPKQVQSLNFPVLKSSDNLTFTAGLCSVLRWIIKRQIQGDPNHFAKSLLGFRGGCLMACSEVSAWTSFCENDMLEAVKNLFPNSMDAKIYLPKNLVRLEKLLSFPVRTHNILKRKQDISKANQCEEIQTLFNKMNLIDNAKDEFKLNHIYAEGIDRSLADFILLPCVHFLLHALQDKAVKILDYFPLVFGWYQRMISDIRVKEAVTLCGLEPFNIEMNGISELDVIIPDVPMDTLYMRNPKRSKVKARGQDPIPIITKLKEHQIEPFHSSFPSSMDEGLDWHSLPLTAHPAGGDLPLSRVDRKCQQVESMVITVMDLALPDDVIVDFCSGGGHVGILLAYYLPKCKILMIENKEESLHRARERAFILELDNVFFFQCNLDHFKGHFNIAVALHACGVATDLVIEKCLQQRAKFVCCPCCYGAISNLPTITYPRSRKFQQSGITTEDFIHLCHCADRTEVDSPSESQGKYCMSLIDTDRYLYVEENNYNVRLCTLQPPDCTPKSNLLIGIPK